MNPSIYRELSVNLGEMHICEHPIRHYPIGYLNNTPKTETELETGYPPTSITVVGIGDWGASISNLLSRTQPGIKCYEVRSVRAKSDSKNRQNLIRSVVKSDLFFLISDLKDLYATQLISSISSLARQTKSFSIGIAPQHRDDYQQLHTDATIYTPGIANCAGQDLKLMKMFIAKDVVQLLTDVILLGNAFFIDFADITYMLNKGRTFLMGEGIASGKNAGEIAADLALGEIRNKQIDKKEATVLLGFIEGSTVMTMDDFHIASMAMHDFISDGCDFIISPIQKETTEPNIKVSVLASFADNI